MKKNTKRKKAILLLYTYIILLLSPKIKENTNKIVFNEEYNITNNLLFATYNGKSIYIGKKIYLNEIIDKNSHNIYIIDERSKENPSLGIYDSYKIRCIDDIKNILKIILTYEEMYPSKWNRTTESMLNEWIIHNICYTMNIEQYRTKKVDLDNYEEEKYSQITKILSIYR